MTIFPGVAAEHLIFDHLSMEQGLVNNAVSGIVQDRRGYLWFGTQNGLNRYDGKDFLIFDSHPFDRNSLPHNQIQTLYLDPVEPYLWVGTYEGLSRMNLETWEFRNFTSDPKRSSQTLSNGIVTSIVRDREGHIWVGTLEGLNRIDPLTMEIRAYYHSEDDPASLLHNTVRALEIDHLNRLWVGSYGGLDLYDPQTDGFVHYRADPEEPRSLGSPYVMAIKNSPDGQLWIGTWDGGVFLFDPEEGAVKTHFPLKENVYLLSPEAGGTLWIGTWGGGLFRHQEGQEGLTHYEADPDDPYKLNHGIVYSFLKDRSGLYWIGTNGGGVNKVNPRKKDFRYLYHRKGEDLSLPMDNVIKILEDSQGNFWVGTYTYGLWRFPAEGSDSPVRHWMPREDDPRSLSHENVHTILEDSKGTIWIGSLGGLDRFDPEGQNFVHIPLAGIGYDDFLEPIIYAMEEDRDGTFWIGTYSSGVIHWSPVEGLLGQYSYQNEGATLSNNLVSTMSIDSRGTLWVGTNRGLNRFDRRTGRFEFYYHDIDDKHSLSSNYISVIREDSLGNLWIGTDGGGLNLFDRKKGTFRSIMRKDGLLSNHIQSILQDSRNRLWIATLSGINIMNLQTGEILAVDSSDGIMSPKLDRGAVKGRDGALYFGSRAGILRFEPTILYDNFLPPSLWFNDVQVMGESIAFEEYLKSGQVLVLPWDRNYLTFEFAALDFTSPDRNLYKYKMNGLDRDWVSSGNRNYASYSNLKPGRYTFSVQGSNNDGFWNTDSLDISIEIQPPPWQQKWFLLLYIVLGFLLFLLLSNLLANYLLKKRLRDAEISRMDLQLLNSKLEELAWNDALTGLGNRRFFDLSLYNLWNLAVREKKTLAVLMIDVDFFKAYNDFYGHRMGDEALRKTAAIIKSVARRGTDTVCRYGGEEFSVLMYDTPPQEARALSDALLRQFAWEGIPHEASKAAPYLSISIGVAAVVPACRQDPEILLKAADKALYTAKGNGRNRVEWSDPIESEEDRG